MKKIIFLYLLFINSFVFAQEVLIYKNEIFDSFYKKVLSNKCLLFVISNNKQSNVFIIDKNNIISSFNIQNNSESIYIYENQINIVIKYDTTFIVYNKNNHIKKICSDRNGYVSDFLLHKGLIYYSTEKTDIPIRAINISKNQEILFEKNDFYNASLYLVDDNVYVLNKKTFYLINGKNLVRTNLNLEDKFTSNTQEIKFSKYSECFFKEYEILKRYNIK